MSTAVQATQRSGLTGFVERQLESLSPRDRRLLVGLIAVFTLVFIVAVWWTLSGILSRQAATVKAAKEKLGQMQQLQTEYQGAQETLKAQEGRLAQFKDEPVGAWVEKLAQEQNVIQQLRAVNETTSETVGGLTQTHFKVQLSRAEYDPMLDFLYALETSGYPASVEVASIHASSLGKDKGKVYDLTLEIVVYSLAETP
jgi:type II secretory pathway component PulM